MRETIFMRVLFCKIHCTFMCFCKPSAAHLYTPGPLKLENTPQIAVSSCVDEAKSVPKSCIRKLPIEQVEKKRVQWMDEFGKQLAEIKVFESSETGHMENEEESNRCLCVIL